MKDYNLKIILRKNVEKWIIFIDGCFKFEENNKLVEIVFWYWFFIVVRDKGICFCKYIEFYFLVGIGVYCLWLFEIFLCIWIIVFCYYVNLLYVFILIIEEFLCWLVRIICN